MVAEGYFIGPIHREVAREKKSNCDAMFHLGRESEPRQVCLPVKAIVFVGTFLRNFRGASAI